MTEVSRPRGRPPKVRPEAKSAEPVVEAAVFEPLQSKPAEEPVLALASKPRMIEVELIRKYAPEGQATEIKTVVHPGTVMELPVAEATRALKLGIARGTDRTFRQ